MHVSRVHDRAHIVVDASHVQLCGDVTRDLAIFVAGDD
jgi:hypothetical protein